MANAKEPENLTPFLSLAMFQHYCKDFKLTQTEWDKACNMLNEKGSYPVDELTNNIKSCVGEVRETKAQDKADKAEAKADREAKKLAKGK